MKVEDYTVVDVETPNNLRSSICQIGLREVRRGEVVYEFSSLINPEDEFTPICINVHHIWPQDVQDAPTFAQVWNLLEEHYRDHVIVAHSASFDVTVISRTLARYGINLNNVDYLCSHLLAKRIFTQLSKERNDLELPASYSLESLCHYYHIDLSHHHDAMSDTVACHLVFESLQREGEILPTDYHHYYDPKLGGYYSAKYAKTDFELGDAGATYAFTGCFAHGSHNTFKSIVENSGGIVHKSLRLDTNFLICGSLNQEQNIHNVQMQKAKSMQKLNYPIQIFSEQEFLSKMEAFRWQRTLY
ncbi:hypothetical protein IJT10_02110 [bacterium]|nr:hypothetical protein [bacterium]